MDPSLRSRKNGIAASQAYSPPAYYYPELEAQRPRLSNSLLRTASLTALCLAAPALLYTSAFSSSFPFPRPPTPSHVQDGLRSCRDNAHQPGPPADFGDRTTSDRFVPGTKAVLIRNATIWTGEDMGNEVLESSDLLLDGGIIKAVGSVGKDALKGLDYDVRACPCSLTSLHGCSAECDSRIYRSWMLLEPGLLPESLANLPMPVATSHTPCHESNPSRQTNRSTCTLTLESRVPPVSAALATATH